MSAHNAALHRSDVHSLSTLHGLFSYVPSIHPHLNRHSKQGLLRYIFSEYSICESGRHTYAGAELIRKGALAGHRLAAPGERHPLF